MTAQRTYGRWNGFLLCAVLALGGCWGARPNKPGTATLTEVVTPDGARERTVKLVNDENPKEPMSATLDGMSVNTGGSTPFDLSAISGEPLFWIGGGFILLGLIITVVRLTPWGAFLAFLPVWAGFAAMGVGAGICILPWVGLGIQKAMPLIVLGGIGFAVVWWLGYRNDKAKNDERKWQEEMKERERDLLIDGDKRAAGAVHMVRTGNRMEAKAIANSGTGDGNKGASA